VTVTSLCPQITLNSIAKSKGPPDLGVHCPGRLLRQSFPAATLRY